MPEGLEATWQNKTRKGPYIRTHLGNEVHLDDPQPEDFDPADIAYHLAGINRYTGGSRFTVAQHCVVAAEMARRFYPGEKFLPARMLIHDADEAFYGDVSSPLKSLLPDYKRFEELAQLAVEERFNLTFIGDPLVREVDYRMWISERQYCVDLGGYGNQDYKGALVEFPLDASEVFGWFKPWTDTYAEAEWLNAYRKLFSWCQ